MPTEIVHAGLRAETLQLLQKQLPVPDATFVEAPAVKPSSAINGFANQGVFLLGEQVVNPISEVQEIYRLDKHLSILLLTSGASYQRIRQALQFSPFIGPTVQCLSTDNPEQLPAIVAEHTERTRQRRSYARIHQPNAPAASASTQRFEQNRADYLGKMIAEAPIGALLLNSQGAVISINVFGAGLFGKTEAEVLNTPLYRLFPEKEQPGIQQFILQGYRQNSQYSVSIPAAQGQLYLEVSVTEISGSQPVLKVCLINDITRRELAQQRTEQHLAELEAANLNLVRVNNDLDTFVYTASHDLKSPILNIQGLVGILKDELTPAPPTVEEPLNRIERSVIRFLATLNDLTEVAKIQKGHNDGKTELLLTGILEEVTDMIRFEIERTSAIITAFTEAAPTLVFSRRNLRSILYNLISNGIKYCPASRRPQITIKSRIENGFFVIEVSDNGMGIPEAKLENIFGLFNRLHPSIEGTGIGLYIVKRVLDNHKGHINVESKLGQGSTFTVFLPQ